MRPGWEATTRIVAIIDGARVEDFPFLVCDADFARLDLVVAHELGLSFTPEAIRSAGLTRVVDEDVR